MAQEPGNGAILQLAAVGAQECMVRGPCWSPFHIQYKRSTPFAAWTQDHDMVYTPGARTQLKIPKSGTLLTDMYLEITLPKIDSAPEGSTWCACVGYGCLRRVRLLLNDQEIHNIERLWMDLYDLLYTDDAHAAGLDRMVGRTPLPMNRQHILHIPLRFLCCRPGRSRAPLPLQAITQADLILDIEWESPSVVSRGVIETDPGISIRVLTDYVELDEMERAESLKGATMVFESVIDSDGRNFYVDSDGDIQPSPVCNVNIGNFRYSVKGLVWVAYEEDADLFTYITDPLESVSIQFQRQERQGPMVSGYYELVQPYVYAYRSYPGPPGVYSFALQMTDRANTGSADFAGLAQSSILGTTRREVPNIKLKVFALYYNIVHITPSAAKVMYV